MDLNRIRHPKEKTYFAILLIVGILIWLVLLVATYGILVVFLLIFAFIAWLIELYFRAIIYGETVNVNRNQYPDIYGMVLDQSGKLGITPPEVFIYNGNGMINAFAIRFLSKKYVFLMGDLVDLMLERERFEELSFIIGHELGHHYAGHTNPLKNILIKPGYIVPFLGAAYSRACELTADRVGYLLINNLQLSQNALAAVALGSRSLGNRVNLDEFVAQERKIPAFMGFIYKLYASHPRMTRRILELQRFNKLLHGGRF